MPNFNNINEVKAYLKEQIAMSLGFDVADTVRNYEQDAINDVVYTAYIPPMVYVRRGDDGGLRDRNNMIAELENGGSTLTVYNMTPFNTDYGGNNSGYSLDLLVEYGHGGGGYKYDYQPSRYEFVHGDFRIPRPFTKKTIENLDKNDAVRKSLASSLRKNGIDAFLK